MTFRDEFVEKFGEHNALKIEWAAQSHMNGAHDILGSDPFRWAILICIGSECISRFADHHKITCSWPDVREWLLTKKEYICAHDGDFDYIAAFCGAYDEFVR